MSKLFFEKLSTKSNHRLTLFNPRLHNLGRHRRQHDQHKPHADR